MNNALPQTPPPLNEPVRSYAPGSPERASLKRRLQELKAQKIDIPAFIGGEEVRTDDTVAVRPPHDHEHRLGTMHRTGAKETERAVQAALDARAEWAQMPWTERAAVFLRAADLLAGPWRDTLNASTMLGQSKNPHQAEIDAACELIDFFRFNVRYMEQIYAEQPRSSGGMWNRMQYRPLEGFVLAVTPFNFTSIAANLPTAPALMGNTVVWKPSTTSVYSAYFIYKLLEEAGLPAGVINMVPGHGPTIGDVAFTSPDFAGLHFTGSTSTFQKMWKQIGDNIERYKTYPRIVGETGGKDFIIAHPSADLDAVATAAVRGSFEYQGQKCSAASRLYLPQSTWPELKERIVAQLDEVKMGPVEDFSCLINAVIDRRSFDKITGYIDRVEDDEHAEVIYGGDYDDSEGFFVEPTIIEAKDPNYRTMCEEISGPVVPAYAYDDARFEEMLALVDRTSPYALTGAIFARDRRAVRRAMEALENAAGNFYINDKPTGAVVSQQPFGGARKSGTNDKAGSRMNLMRWVSARSIKENLNPPKHFGYAFLEEDADNEPSYAERGDGSVQPATHAADE